MSIIIEGNVVDGMSFHGPFDDHEDAIEWAEANLKTDWLVATLQDPLSDVRAALVAREG